MERWTLKPNPSPRDPARHVLCLRGDMKDVLTLVRRFGALCGRPSRFEGPGGFDYSLFLHAVSAEKLSEVESTLREMFPGASPVPALPSAAPPPPPPTPAPVPASPPPTPAPPAPIPAPKPSGAQIKMEPTPALFLRRPDPCAGTRSRSPPPLRRRSPPPCRPRPGRPVPCGAWRFHWIPSGISSPSRSGPSTVSPTPRPLPRSARPGACTILSFCTAPRAWENPT